MRPNAAANAQRRLCSSIKFTGLRSESTPLFVIRQKMYVFHKGLSRGNGTTGPELR